MFNLVKQTVDFRASDLDGQAGKMLCVAPASYRLARGHPAPEGGQDARPTGGETPALQEQIISPIAAYNLRRDAKEKLSS
jgi:hypothetical protein